MQNSPGILVIDEPSKNYYPIASKADGNDDVLVGRIRRDFSVRSGLNIWVVADNLRKGAASNAVQILEVLLGTGQKNTMMIWGRSKNHWIKRMWMMLVILVMLINYYLK